MRFTQLTSFITASLILVADQATAVNYRAYSSTVTCSGPSFGCSDNGGACCGPMPTGFGFSAQFDNLPIGTQGQGYANNVCSAFLFDLLGPGTKCWNGGGRRAITLNWFHSPGGRVAARDEAADGGAKACTAPNIFTYKTPEGVERTIRIPKTAANASEAIAGYYGARNWDALAAYEDA